MTPSAEPTTKRRRRAKAPLRMDMVVQETAANVVLLGMAWWLGMSFLGFMLLLAGEAVIVMMLGTTMYGRRPIRWYLRRLVSLVGGLALFVGIDIFFFGVITASHNQLALHAVLASLRQLELSLLGWGLLYTTGHLAIALWVAKRRPDPRTAFAQQGQMQAGVTSVALMIAVPAIFIGGSLALAATTSLGLAVPADAVVIALLVLVRYALLLRFCRHSEQEWADIVDSFY